jgi:LacI family transcriptional regulator
MQHENSVNILIDNRQAAYNATRHLIEQGCRRIMHITAPTLQNVYKDRLKGYKEALGEHKIRFREDYVAITNLSQEAGTEVAKMILKMKPLPDGVFVANDSCAIGCMLALKQQGIRIPQDIAFVGFNNDPVTQVIEPHLTTINYSGYEMGQVAARHLINHVRDVSFVSSTNTIILRSELIVRASSLKKGSN